MSKTQEKLNFFEVYERGLRIRGWNCVDLYRETSSNNLKLSLRSLQRYLSRESLPTFYNAKEILRIIGIQASDDQIREALATADENRYDNMSKNNYMQRGVRLKISQLSEEIDDPGIIMVELNNRIRSMPKRKRNFNQYVTALIKMDIDKHILGE